MKHMIFSYNPPCFCHRLCPPSSRSSLLSPQRRALAWCHESVSTSPSGGYDNGAAASSSPPRQSRDFLAIGTSAGAVLVLAVDIGTNANANAVAAAKPPTSPVRVDAGGGGSSAPARVRSGGITTAVKAVPLRRVCASDRSPVTFLAFVVPGGNRWGAGSSEQGDSCDSPSSSVSVFVSRV